MPKFRFNKLVRDKIVEQQQAGGARPVVRRLQPGEHKAALVAKLAEEAQEILTASAEELATELADVQQVLDDLRHLSGVSAAEVAAAQQCKNERSGAFRHGDFVDYVEADEANQWVAYYRQNADRYPEID